jgi:hypothetical protein
MAESKVILGGTFDSADEARAHALVLRDEGLQVRVIGPARTARIQGVGENVLQWPAGATADRFLVIATDSAIETPPKKANP